MSDIQFIQEIKRLNYGNLVELLIQPINCEQRSIILNRLVYMNNRMMDEQQVRYYNQQVNFNQMQQPVDQSTQYQIPAYNNFDYQNQFAAPLNPIDMRIPQMQHRRKDISENKHPAIDPSANRSINPAAFTPAPFNGYNTTLQPVIQPTINLSKVNQISPDMDSILDQIMEENNSASSTSVEAESKVNRALALINDSLFKLKEAKKKNV